jgi:hypothetical protein
MIKVLRVDGSEQEVAGKISLPEAQKAVGGYVEVVKASKVAFLVDEDGRRKGKPINHKASALAGVMLVGDVILLEGTSKRAWS